MIEQVNLEEGCQSRVQWEKGHRSEKFSEVKKSGESVRATPKSNSVDNVRALQGDATVLEDAIKL